ncbi:hypothetical protein [Photobacterium damselae]|uniref:hypothetical protein n=1 Tax=Photobacterium damselae TaxID=38293 RepID=UPI000D660665|nr:hypothetical protein [Photobacterium damselae]AWK84304.1 hypothetical protein BST98_20255 [Photobacterium damselae]
MKNLNRITVGEMIGIEKEFLNSHSISRMSLTQIGKSFIHHISGYENTKNSYQDYRNLYVTSTGNSSAPDSEVLFYEYIASTYLHLESDPKEKIIELYFKASDDIKEIELRLNYIQSELDLINEQKRRNGWLDGKDRYYKKLLDYYYEKNSQAKNEVMEFISKDLEAFSITKCRKLYSSFINLGNEMPYRYSKRIMHSPKLDSYDVRNVTELSNKFLDLPIPAYLELHELYHSNKDDFFDFAREYANGELDGIEGIISKTHKSINDSHIINARKNVINAILSHYNSKDYISVVNMLPMQIEGIFHDICIELGIDESRLDISSINEKLRILEDKLSYFIYFEYYSFIFPVIRNKVAHGKLIENDLEYTAFMLMMDLIPLLDLASSKEIPINNVLSLLEKIKGNNFEALIEYFEYRDIVLPTFYEKEADIELAIRSFNTTEFWDFIYKKVKEQKTENINDTDIMKFVKKLHISNICKQKSTEFMKNIPTLIESINNEKVVRKAKVDKIINALKQN